MILDNQTLFSDRQDVTATAGSTNQIDLSPRAAGIVRDIGPGKPIPIVIQVVERFTAAGAATLTVSLQVDEDSAFGSPKTVAVAAAVPVAQLVPGYQFNLDYIPRGTDERYLRVNYAVATGPMTAGRVTAGVVLGGIKPMADVIANQRGYYGRILREEGERFSIPDDVMLNPKLRPSWVRPVKAVQPVEEPANDGAGGASGVDLEAMTVKDLRALARDRGIGIPASATTKADVIATILAGPVDDAPEPFQDAPEPQRVENQINDALGQTQPDWVQPGAEI